MSNRRSGSNNQRNTQNRKTQNRNTQNRNTQNRNTSDRTSKNTNKFTIKMQKKLVVLFVLVLLAFAGLSVRLIFINREDGERYNKQVLSQRKYDSSTLPYRRGDIVDAKGSKLAVSENVYNLVIDSKIILQKKYMEETLQALADNFPTLDIPVIREYITTHPTSSWYVPLKQLTYEEISGFQVQAIEETKLVDCVWFQKEYRRIYPNGSLACDVIGFTGTDNTGMFGLEEYYSDVLNGTNGREYGYLNEDATLERTIKPAIDGNTIHSTIDLNMQGIVEKYLKKFNDENKDAYRPGNGAEDVGCIIMEVNTGNVLAMASYPDFDLNNPKDISKYYTPEEIAAMDEAGTTYETLNNLWRNFCVSDTYEPGSTAKPFTTAAALETGAITGNSSFQCNGVVEIGGKKIKCHGGHGCGHVTPQDAIAWSCNMGLIQMAQAMGIDLFATAQETFNFGLKTNVDLAGEARTAGLIYTADTMGPTELATGSFGQGFNATMIQMITGFCSLINGGYYYEPHMVDKITNSSGATVESIEPRVLKQTISESTSAKIRQYCRATVMPEGGDKRTGTTARPAGYAIGGKTGTAQKVPYGDKQYVVSFMGYAPAENPQIAIYVVVNRVNAEYQDKARHATGIVRNVLSEVLPYLGIFMTEELSEEEIKELEERDLEITNMYAPKPDEESETGTEETEGTGEAEGTGEQGEAGDDEEKENLPPWMLYEKDPETGNFIEPGTGEHIDPVTGEYVNKDNPALE